MRIPRFWAKGATSMTVTNPATGRPRAFTCWGWSDTSVADAADKAKQRADAIAAKVRQGLDLDRYPYGVQPMREPVIEEWNGADGSLSAAITLNGYGCNVLNAARAMFVDIDLPSLPSLGGIVRGLRSLFGGTKPKPIEQIPAIVMDRIGAVVELDASCGVRIYRTRAGLRCLFTHRQASPVADTTIKLMTDLGADPLYVKLCKMQECFRARLTPKPWRCGMHTPPVRYPWADAAAERAMRDWSAQYAKAADRFATCALVEQIGPKASDPDIVRIIEVHDKATKVGTSLELA